MTQKRVIINGYREQDATRFFMSQIKKIFPPLLFLLVAQVLWGTASWAEDSAAADVPPPAVDAGEKLQEVSKLAEAGAPGLALRLMDQTQPALRSEPEHWTVWEEQRLKILMEHEDWDTVAARVAEHPTDLPTAFSRWARTQQAQAYLNLHQGRAARQTLRALILSVADEDSEKSGDRLQEWRRMIIHSYLADGLNDDALIAIRRYRQDYSHDQAAFLLLRARVLLLNQRSAEAAELLTEHTQEPQAAMLYLLAQLRSEERSAVKVMQTALRHLRGKWADKSLRTALWAVVAEAAQRKDDQGARVNALEHVVANTRQAKADKLFTFDADSLWDAYLDYAVYAGNQARLLLGQDKAWFKYAAGLEKKDAVKQRALYALLMQRGSEADVRLKAANLFIKSMHSRRNNSYLIRQLFLQSKRYPALADVPEPIRRVLVDIALARQDIPLASQIMATLDEPPPGKTSYMWHLRRARILIMGGQPRQGALALARFTQMYPKANRTQIDRFLQVVFDLQTVGEHDAAYRLFQDVITATRDKKLHRELYYWMADSRQAQSRHAEAAELYLKSAMLLDGKGWDPWGQTARYQAAKALGKAGLIDDAHFIYQRLLKVTKEEDRRAVLRYEMQKLQLAKNVEEHHVEEDRVQNNSRLTEQADR